MFTSRDVSVSSGLAHLFLKNIKSCTNLLDDQMDTDKCKS